MLLTFSQGNRYFCSYYYKILINWKIINVQATHFFRQKRCDNLKWYISRNKNEKRDLCIRKINKWTTFQLLIGFQTKVINSILSSWFYLQKAYAITILLTLWSSVTCPKVFHIIFDVFSFTYKLLHSHF